MWHNMIINLHLVVPRSPPNSFELLRVHGHRVLPVLLQHRQRLLVVHLPHPVRIPWNPDLGEGDEFGSGGARFVNEIYGLPDAAF
jgi:hypothetical protein